MNPKGWHLLVTAPIWAPLLVVGVIIVIVAAILYAGANLNRPIKGSST